MRPMTTTHLRWEPSPRWVRGVKGDTTVVDSPNPVLVWDPHSEVPVPHYAFPTNEIRTDLLKPGAGRPGVAGSKSWYDLVLDGEVLENVAFSYPAEELPDHIAFEWFMRPDGGLDHWYEENEEIFVHPRDPYHRVDPIRSSRHVRVEIDGHVVADSRRPILLFETHLPVRYYIPPEDVNFDLLEPTDAHTRCPYKGIASYWSLRAGASNGAGTTDGNGARSGSNGAAAGDSGGGDSGGGNGAGSGSGAPSNVAWAYPDPIPEAGKIANHVAFYNEAVDHFVDGVRLTRPVTIFTKRLADS